MVGSDATLNATLGSSLKVPSGPTKLEKVEHLVPHHKGRLTRGLALTCRSH